MKGTRPRDIEISCATQVQPCQTLEGSLPGQVVHQDARPGLGSTSFLTCLDSDLDGKRKPEGSLESDSQQGV